MLKKAPTAPPYATLRALVHWLRAEQVPGLVIGGVAASLLGRPRLTLDVDVAVLLDENRWEKFLSTGTRFGFMPRIRDALAFARRSRVFLLNHRPSGVDVDISLVALLFEEESIARAKWTDVGGLSIPLPTPEDLIIMKAVAHRPRDLADVESLLDAHPRLNLRRVRRWVREFSSALEKPEILHDLEKAIARRQKRKRKPV